MDREKRYPAGRLTAVFLCAVLCALLSAAAAWGSPTYSEATDRASIEDRAGILSADEEYALLGMAASLSKDTGFEIRVLTTDNAGGLSTAVYAENYFESLSDDYSGGCYVLDLDNREYYVATYGDLRYYLTDERIRQMILNASSAARSGDWEGTLSSMLMDTVEYCRAGVQAGTALYDEDTGSYTYYEAPKGITPVELLVSAFLGLIGFLMMFVSTKRRYEMKVPETNDYSAEDNVSLHLRRHEDTLIDRHVTTRRIPRNNDDSHHGSGGGGGGVHISTVHHTSGGHSAGGGGGHF